MYEREIITATDRPETRARAGKAKEREICRACMVEETTNLQQEENSKPSQFLISL